MVKKSPKKSALAQLIDSTNARENIRYEKPKAPGGGSLPGGIDNGIAKLTKLDFDPIASGDYEGKPRFYCHGVCVSPKEHEGIPIEGRLVQPGLIKLCDTKGQDGKEVSFAENLAKAENRLKLMGFPTEDFDPLDADAISYFEANQEEGIYFSFSTWKPDGSDRVIVIVRGAVDDYNEEGDDGVDDDTTPAPAMKAKAKPAASKAKPAAKKAKPVVEDLEEEEEEEEEEGDDDGIDLDAVAKKADKGDQKSQLIIDAEAKKLGIDASDDEFETFASVIVAIKKAMKKKPSKAEPEEEEEEEEEEEAEDIVPSKGEIYNFTPAKSKKSKECEVTKVLKRTKVVNLKSLNDDMEYEDIPWSALSEVE